MIWLVQKPNRGIVVSELVLLSDQTPSSWFYLLHFNQSYSQHD